MKTIFLTSDIGSYKIVDGVIIPCAIFNGNKLVDHLKETIKKYDNFVFVASNPIGFAKTDGYATIVSESFKLSGLGFKNIYVLDDRTKESANDIISQADFIYLAGGHVPTQNAFFKSLNLKELLSDFNGVVMGQSAGSMNLASKVYNYPEDISEINDIMRMEGLGLTNLTVVPHFDLKKGALQVDDSIDLMNDYLLKDSYETPLYGITNGSHIKISNGKTEFFGENYIINKGKIEKVKEEPVFESKQK